jgi:alanine dehydrogenase
MKKMNLPLESLLPEEKLLKVEQNKREITIGIPKEQNKTENRIALVPQSVELFTNYGYKVLIERGAGQRANFSDKDYSEQGAIITDDKAKIFESDIVLKIAPPTIEELKMMKDGKIIISAFHSVSQKKKILNVYKQKRLTAFGFEYMKDDDNYYPFVRAMSEIAGIASVLIASELLSTTSKGMGKLLGGITGVNPTEVVIIGAGTVGENAARTALSLGASVKVFDSSIHKLRSLKQKLCQNIYTSVLQPRVLENAIKKADVVIAAKWVDEGRPVVIITRDLIRSMKKGAVIIDVSIDKGGILETSRITSLDKPTFTEHGVIHYGVPNIASKFARTSSYAISNLLEDLLLELASAANLETALKVSTTLRTGAYFFRGILTNSSIAEFFGVSYKDINLIISAL